MEQIENIRFRSDFYHDLKLQKEFNQGIRDARLFYRFIYLYIIGIFFWTFWYMVIQMDMPEIYANTTLFMCFIWVLVEFIWFLITRGGGVYYKRSLMLNGGNPTPMLYFFVRITSSPWKRNPATRLRFFMATFVLSMKQNI